MSHNKTNGIIVEVAPHSRADTLGSQSFTMDSIAVPHHGLEAQDLFQQSLLGAGVNCTHYRTGNQTQKTRFDPATIWLKLLSGPAFKAAASSRLVVVLQGLKQHPRS